MSYGNPFKEKDSMYKMLMAGTNNVLSAIEKSGTVKRLIYTSSGAAVKGPGPPGYLWSEKDWCGPGGPDDMSTWFDKKRGINHFTNANNPYGKGKMDSELRCYAWGKEKGIDVISIIPEHACGPIMAKSQVNGWQADIGQIFVGRYHREQLWGVTDVRDCAEGFRLAAESRTTQNGRRYFIITPPEFGGAPTPAEIVKTLQSLYPDEKDVGGPKEKIAEAKQYMPVQTTLAQNELGLRYHHVRDTFRDNIESLKALGALDDFKRRMAESKAKKAAAAKSKL
jgi:nucleoside-diphosphate-sugar epimerase